jgi:hypothetical protein
MYWRQSFIIREGYMKMLIFDLALNVVLLAGN